MKCATVLFIFLTFAIQTSSKTNLFKFRKGSLDNFNGARRILASGDIAKLVEVIAFIPGLKEIHAAGLFGPAANMNKLAWNRQLEQAGFEYLQENGASLKDVLTTLHYKDYIGFYWMGNLIDFLQTIITALPVEKLQKKLQKYLDLIEKILIILWMGYAAPKSWPIAKGEYYGAAEALYATRYEIGCYSDLLKAICFVKKKKYEEKLFQVGAACSACATHCEYFLNEEGDYEDGELCVLPKDIYTEQQVEYKSMEDVPSAAFSLSLLAIFAILPIYFLRRH